MAQRVRSGEGEHSAAHQTAYSFVESVLDALEAADPSRCPSTAASALRTAAAMDAVLAPYYGGTREDAFWERPHTWASAATGL